MRTRIKICGITRVGDANVAANLGVDAIGLVFYPGSPRFVNQEQAAKIIANTPAFVTKVGLFVDADKDTIQQTIAALAIDLLQFHGDETPEFCESFDLPYIKVCRIQPGTDIKAYAKNYRSMSALLLDSYQLNQFGGTGESFAWSLVPEATEFNKPLILAGGLSPDNIVNAIKTVKPYAVDVSSGVEAAKGIKDPQKLAAFINGVVTADNRG